MGSKEGRGPHTDKTTAAKSRYRSINLDGDILHCLLCVLSFYRRKYPCISLMCGSANTTSVTLSLIFFGFSVVWRASPGTGEHGGGGQLHLSGGHAPRLHPRTHPPTHRPSSLLRQAQLLGRSPNFFQEEVHVFCK